MGLKDTKKMSIQNQFIVDEDNGICKHKYPHDIIEKIGKFHITLFTYDHGEKQLSIPLNQFR